MPVITIVVFDMDGVLYRYRIERWLGPMQPEQGPVMLREG
jgi:hypothetical protein